MGDEFLVVFLIHSRVTGAIPVRLSRCIYSSNLEYLR